MINAINSVRLNSPGETEEQSVVVTQPSFRGEDFEKAPVQDEFVYADEVEEKKSNKGLIIGLASAAVLAGGFFMGRAGMLGNWMKKITGGLKKEAKEVLNAVKDKKLSELSAEEKEKVTKVLNPDNDAKIAEKIEKLFKEKSDSTLEELVEIDSRKLKEKVAEVETEVKKPEEASNKEGIQKEEPMTEEVKKDSELKKPEPVKEAPKPVKPESINNVADDATASINQMQKNAVSLMEMKFSEEFTDFAYKISGKKLSQLTSEEIETMSKFWGKDNDKELVSAMKSIIKNCPDKTAEALETQLSLMKLFPESKAAFQEGSVIYKKIADLTPEELNYFPIKQFGKTHGKPKKDETLIQYFERVGSENLEDAFGPLFKKDLKFIKSLGYDLESLGINI